MTYTTASVAPPPDRPLDPEAQAAADRLAADLRRLGVSEGGVLLVHSSLSALGFVPGGPETVIRGLRQALGAAGTLLLPSLSYERVTEKHPFFDIRRTPSNVGAIPEAFRKRPGTARSMHPTHSVCAVGPRSGELLGDHDLDTTPCGPHSPFRKLPAVDGQILMLGCGLQPNTSMHAIEETVVPAYLFGPELTYVLTYADGRSVEKTYTTHGFYGWEQRYEHVAEILEPPALVSGPVLAGTARLICARSFWEAVQAELVRDPLRFVARDER
jgi:aminoglycoside 3-N-acetyltransferase